MATSSRTYSGTQPPGHTAADPQLAGAASRPRLPGPVQGVRARDPAPDGDPDDTFVHPAGYCQNVLAPGAAWSPDRTWSTGREASSSSAITRERPSLAADRPDFHLSLAVDRETGVILRLVETIGGLTTRQADVVSSCPTRHCRPGLRLVSLNRDTLLY